MNKLMTTFGLLLVSSHSTQAVIDWDGDTTLTSEGYETWIIAEAPYASNAPVIDGVISAGEWDDATVNPLENSLLTPAADAMSAQFRVKWDETNIYVLVEAEDETGMSTTGHLFEIYISTAYTRKFGAWQIPGYEENDYQIACSINPEDTFYSLGLYSSQTPLDSFSRANTVDGISYISEVSIAWADLGGLPGESAVNPDYIGFEVQTQRNAPEGGSNSDRSKLAWSDVSNTAWAATEDWGTLRLLEGGTDPGQKWAGYDVVDGWINTGDFLGWLNVEIAPWLYSLTMGKYVFMPENNLVSEQGGWLFIPR